MNNKQAPTRPGYERVGIGRFETLLRRLFAVKGQVAPDVFPQITPVVSVEPWQAPEHEYLRQVMLAHGSVEVPAVAAQFPEVSVRQLSLGVLTIVERIVLYVSVNSTIRVSVGAALPGVGAGLSEAQPVDTRWGTQSPTTQVQGGTNAAIALLSDYARYVVLAAQSPTVIQGPWVLTNQQSLNIEGETANVIFRMSAVWRERPLEASEVR